MSESTEEGDWYDGRITQFRVGIAPHNMSVLGVCVRYDYDGSTEWVRMPDAASEWSDLDVTHDCAENVRFRIGARVVTYGDDAVPALAFVHSQPDLDAPAPTSAAAAGSTDSTPVRVLDFATQTLTWTQLDRVHAFAAPACSAGAAASIRAFAEVRALQMCRAASAAAVHGRITREGHGLCACVLDPSCPVAAAAALFGIASRTAIRKEKPSGSSSKGDGAPSFAAHEWLHVDITPVVSIVARSTSLLIRDAPDIAAAAPPGTLLATVTAAKPQSLAQPAAATKRPAGKASKPVDTHAAVGGGPPPPPSPLEALHAAPIVPPPPFSGDIVGAFVCMWVYGHATHVLCEQTDAVQALPLDVAAMQSIFASSMSVSPPPDVNDCSALPSNAFMDSSSPQAHAATPVQALQSSCSLWGHPVTAWIARYSIHTRRHLCVFESPAQLQSRLAALMSGDAAAIRALHDADTAADASPRIVRMAWLDLARIGAIVMPRTPALRAEALSHAPPRSSTIDAALPCVMCLGFENLPSLCCSSAGGCGGRRVHGACMDPPHSNAASLPRSVMDEYAAPHANAFLDVASILRPPAAVTGDDARAHSWLCALCRSCDNCGSRNADGERPAASAPPATAPATPAVAAFEGVGDAPPIVDVKPEPVAPPAPEVAPPPPDVRTSFLAVCASLDERGSHLGRTAAAEAASASSTSGSGHWVLHSYVPVPGTRVYDTRRRAALSGDVAHAHASVSPSEPVILLLCVKCGSRCAAGHYCPVCHMCYAEDSISMVACDACVSWIHTACDGLGMQDLALMEAGTHPVWGSRYTCPLCRHRLMVEVMHALRATEGCAYFTMPVAVKDAPGYHAIITQPMDLWTLSCNLDAGVYDSTGAAGTAAFRAHVDLIARNALTFNTPQDGVYAAAWKFQKAAAAIFALKLPMTTDAAFRDEFNKLRAAEATQARVGVRGAPQRGGRGGLKRPRPVEEPVRTVRKGLPPEHVFPRLAAPMIHVPRVQSRELWIFPPSSASLDLCVLCERIIAAALARGSVIDDAAADEPSPAELRDAFACVAQDGSDAHVHVHGVTTTYMRDVLRSRALAAVLARMQTTWRCDDCAVCITCGIPASRASPRVRSCLRCGALSHVYCATPTIPQNVGEQWCCHRCVDCVHCNASSWSTRVGVCHSCVGEHTPSLPTLLTASGDMVDASRTAAVADSCPVCTNAWDSADTSLVQCDVCSGWVHGDCDPVFIGAHTRAVLAELDAAARYVCKMCRCSSVAMCMDAARACVERCVSVRTHIRTLLMTQRMAQASASLAEYAHLLAPAGASTAAAPQAPANNIAIAAARVRARVSRDYASPLRAVKRHTHAVHTGGVAAAWLRAYEDPRVQQVRANMRAAVRARGSAGGTFPLSAAQIVAASFTAHSLTRALRLQLLGASPASAEMPSTAIDDVVLLPASAAPVPVAPSSAAVSIVQETAPSAEALPKEAVDAAFVDLDDRVCALCGIAGNCASGLMAAEAFAVSHTGAGLLRMINNVTQTLNGTPAAPTRADMIALQHSRRGADALSHAAHHRAAARDRLCGGVPAQAVEQFQGMEGPLLALHVPITRGPTDASVHTTAVHAQCALWSSSALVDDAGVLYTVYSILRRAVRAHCTHCGSVGASLHCSGRGCSSVYHLRCALVAGAHLTSQRACFCSSHMRECDEAGAVAHAYDVAAVEVARTLTRGDATFPAAAEVMLAYLSSRPHARALVYVNSIAALRVADDEAPSTSVRTLTLPSHTALYMPSRTPALTLHPWAPVEQDAVGSTGEAVTVPPRAATDAAVPSLASIVRLHPAAQGGRSGSELAQMPVLRVGACTVLEWGAIDTHAAGVHTEAHIIPHGWRARRRAWWVSTNGQVLRGTYTMRVVADLTTADDGLWPRRTLLFSIACDDDASIDVVDTCPHAALRHLRALLDARAGRSLFLSQEESAALHGTSGLQASVGSRLRWYPLSPSQPGGVAFADDTVDCIPAPSHDSVAVDVCAHGDAFTLNAHVWFGYGLPSVQARLEAHACAPLTAITPAGSAAAWPRHIFRYVQASSDNIADARAAREAASAQRRVNAAGCARMIVYDRTERNHAHKTLAYLAARASGASQPALLELDRVVMGAGAGFMEAAPVSEAEAKPASRTRYDDARAAQSVVSASSSAPGDKSAPGGPDDGSMVVADARLASAFRVMKSIPLWDRICVRRSRIHGWGLFVKVDVPQDGVVIEYTGQLVRTPTADRREIMYEEAHRVGSLSGAIQAVEGQAATVFTPDAARVDAITMLGTPVGTRVSDGSGSCYLFRLDDEWIIDATMKGSAARFMNHCCDPNCYSKAVLVDGEKHIVILAMRELKVGEEVTYNYKFAYEADPAQKIPCYCGASSCAGTMN